MDSVWKDFITFEREEVVEGIDEELLITATLKLQAKNKYRKSDFSPPMDPEASIRNDLAGQLVAFAKNLTSDSCHVIYLSAPFDVREKLRVFHYYEKLTRGGAIVLMPMMTPQEELEKWTNTDWLFYENLVDRKIQLADTLFVIDIDGTDKTMIREIEYAISLGRQIIYQSDMDNAIKGVELGE